MLGSYPPQEAPQEVVWPRHGWEEAPSGMLARGSYKSTLKFIDDDDITHLQFDYGFSIKKDWGKEKEYVILKPKFQPPKRSVDLNLPFSKHISTSLHVLTCFCHSLPPILARSKLFTLFSPLFRGCSISATKKMYNPPVKTNFDPSCCGTSPLVGRKTV